MSCDEFLSLIESMLDGELSVESTARVNGHADQCAVCGPERDRLIMLHERMQHLRDSIPVSASLENRVKDALLEESKKSAESLVRFSRVRILSIAAALICLIAVACYVIADHNKSDVKIAQTTNFAVVSAADLAKHSHDHIVSDLHYSPEQLPALVKQIGFAIQPPVIAHWRLASVCVCSIGKDGLPVAHMTYVSTDKKARLKELTCYQVLKKNFDHSGMDRVQGHEQNPVWSTEVSKTAIASVEGNGVMNIFTSSMPVKNLVSIAAKS